MANTLPPTCPTSLGHSKAKNGRDRAQPQDVCLECLCFRVLAAMGENPRSGWPAVSPPRGAFNAIDVKLVQNGGLKQKAAKRSTKVSKTLPRPRSSVQTRPHDAPRLPQDGLKMASRSSKTSPRSSKCSPKTSPARPQSASKRRGLPQEFPKTPQILPRPFQSSNIPLNL